MIVPMKKVHLVVQDKYQQNALLALRDIGVIHIEKTNAASDGLSKAHERKTSAENALGLIQAYKAPKKKKAPQWYRENASKEQDAAIERRNLIQIMLDMGKERKALEDRCAVLTRERGLIAGWGEFDPASVKELAALGHPVYLYELTADAFAALPLEIRYIKLSAGKTDVRIMVLDTEIPGMPPLPLPQKSLSAMDTELNELDKQLAAIETRLKSFADRRPVLETEIKTILGDIEFETVRAELAQVANVPEAFSFSCLSGFVPAEDLGKLKAAAAENGWALAADDPGPDDNVPTKLKNSKLAQLLNPLTDFLEVVPGYYEADISGWFLFFFVIFFGMIFGDAAYGAIILIASLVGISKTVKKGVPPILKLALLLGISNFIWGALTCTWFGVAVEHVPAVLQKMSLPLISNVTAAQSAYDEGIVRQNLMIFCFSLALLQLSIGHIIAIARCKSVKVLADIGSIAMLAGMYGIVLALIASNSSRDLKEYIPMLPCAYVLGAGFVVNFIFANYEGSVGKSIVESLKNIISMILGIANVFSDIMSYIRLWAVGLAGAAISSTVDTMAGPMLGHLAFFIFGVVLLVFGHGLNLVLNTLSVLVHGVRLNTLEFSGHVGLTWAGTPYKPFTKNGNTPQGAS